MSEIDYDIEVSYDSETAEMHLMITPIKPVEYIEFNFIIKSNNKLKLNDELFEI